MEANEFSDRLWNFAADVGRFIETAVSFLQACESPKNRRRRTPGQPEGAATGIGRDDPVVFSQGGGGFQMVCVASRVWLKIHGTHGFGCSRTRWGGVLEHGQVVECI